MASPVLPCHFANQPAAPGGSPSVRHIIFTMSDLQRYAPYARAGLRGARALYSMYNSTAPVPASPLSRVQNQVTLLSRRINRNAPQVSNWAYTAAFTSTLSGFQATDYSITSGFIGSGSDYTSSVLGDYYRNKRLMLKLDATNTINKVRVLVYWSKKAGTYSGMTDMTTTLDPAAFQVIHDSVFYPITEKSGKFIRINLRDKMTNYNQSSATLESGDLHLRIIFDNPTAASRNVTYGLRLFLQNK